jgi:hypothetical protein
MPQRHDIELITSSRTAVFRCKQCRADFRTVDMGVLVKHHADGTLAEFYARVKQEHSDAPPTKTLGTAGGR